MRNAQRLEKLEVVHRCPTCRLSLYHINQALDKTLTLVEQEMGEENFQRILPMLRAIWLSRELARR